ncbi:UNVERIFIED_CONTAM: hypothetical protein GTU68_066160 [Idotea baltica]|nr:hypothetical protein [Idotea baltica]
MRKLRSRIVGQDHALSAIEDMLATVKADCGVPNRPLSVMFFLGPTGVGKTETVRILAESLLGSADKLCRIDMNTLAQEHYSASISGSPPGYVGSKEGISLFDSDRIQGSYSEPGIVLLDEIEKANKDVVRAILNIFDTGRLVLTSGTKELDFTNSLIFMTSNIGANELQSYLPDSDKPWNRWLKSSSNIDPKAEEKIVDKALHKHFDPEFLNRIDQIIRFNRLDSDLLDSLINIEIEKLNQRLKRRSASITLSSSAKAFVCNDYDQRFGARDIARRIRRELEPKIAKALCTYPKEESFQAIIVDSSISISPVTVS